MKPENRSLELLGETRSKAKMYEYGVPPAHHIALTRDPSRLFSLAIGLLGETAARIADSSETVEEAVRESTDETLAFASSFFDHYRETKLDETLGPYLLLLGSAAFHLSELPGSARVLAKRARDAEMECGGLDRLLQWLLAGDVGNPVLFEESPYCAAARHLVDSMREWYALRSDAAGFLELAGNLRETAYRAGTSRELLMADLVSAVLRRKHANSSRFCLPTFSDLPLEVWRPVLMKDSFMRELWPAQRLLGREGVFKGRAAVVQMPTSAGKTRGIELVIRSALLSGRAEVAAVVAPFKALCEEIRSSLVRDFDGEGVSIDEFSDVMQPDYEVPSATDRPRVLVMTPEKLVYVLRHNPELAGRLGLLVYDEAHQFDSGSRGVTYELLVASLRDLSHRKVQTVLFSAVVGNASELNEWLFGAPSAVVPDRDLTPTRRTIAFASWRHTRGRLEFVEQERTSRRDFYVPRVITSRRLRLLGRERRERLFPDKSDGQSVALYLALKLAGNGSVAVFCGRKDTVKAIANKAIEAYGRGLPMAKPIESSNATEIGRLERLYARNLGADAKLTQIAGLGILSHHSNVPHGIRLAVEDAMKSNRARVVLCTSTLAQGVNMPLRYLIVTSVYQGGESMTVRDFQNLAGRAGRSGMHTEGTVLFADPQVYDERREKPWRWHLVQRLLKADRTEPCGSSLLKVLDPLWGNHGRIPIEWDPLEFIEIYLDDSAAADGYLEALFAAHSHEGLTLDSLHRQVEERLGVIAAVENYIMAYCDVPSDGLARDEVLELANATLAFHLGGERERHALSRLFLLVAGNVMARVPQPARRAMFAKTLYGVTEAISVEDWVADNWQAVSSAGTAAEVLDVLWPLLRRLVRNRAFQNCDVPEVLVEVAHGWIEGRPYCDLLPLLAASGCRFGNRYPTIEYVVEICDHALSYDGALALGAVAEVYKEMHAEDAATWHRLYALQKKLKYGLGDQTAVVLCEMGFRDRVLVHDLAPLLGIVRGRQEALAALRENEAEVRGMLAAEYPSYFARVLDELTS